MADTGENRQIVGRVNGKQAETVGTSSKMVSEELSSGKTNRSAFAGDKDGSSSGSMPITSENAAPPQSAKSNVKGSIRCHKCQMLCVDEHTYVAHTCIPRASSYYMAKRRGNPNWGKTESYTIPPGPSSFESLVKKLKLLPEQYEGSALLKQWALRNKDSKYVPQGLLEAWKFPVKY